MRAAVAALLLFGLSLVANAQAPQPGAPTVVVNGTTGSTTYTYYLVAVDSNGYRSIASATTSVTNGNATLSGSNFNAVSWTIPSGAVSIDVVRSVGGVSQGAISIANSGTSVNDTGLAAKPALCQVQALTSLGTAVFNPDGSAASGTVFRVSKITRNGILLAQGPFTYTTDVNGQLPNNFNLPQGSTAFIYALVPPWNVTGGVALSVPNNSSAQLANLGTVASIPSSGVTIQNNGTTLTSKEGTLNFANGLQAVETSPGFSTVSLSNTGGNNSFGGITTSLQPALNVGPYNTGAGQTGEIRLLELLANGTKYVGFKAPDNIANNVIWRLPAADGSANQGLLTDGSTHFFFANVVSTWDTNTAPANNLSLAMGVFTSTFTTSGNTGSGAVWDILDTTGNTGTGPLFRIRTSGTSTALPLQIFAKGTTNGTHVDSSGIWRADGSGGFDVAALLGVIATGNLPAATVYTNTANTFGAFLSDFGSASLKIPRSAGLAPTASSQIGYDSTANQYRAGINGTAGYLVQAAAALTSNGFVYGQGAGGVAVTGTGNNGVALTNGSGQPVLGSVTANLVISSSTLDTAQGIQTGSNVQHNSLGLGVAPPSVGAGLLDNGATLNTQGSGTVASAEFDALINPSTNATAEYPIVKIFPTLNATGASAGRTVDFLLIDSSNTNTVGLTVNLIKATYGGASPAKFNVDSTGAGSFSTSLSIAGGTALTTTNQTGTGSLVLQTGATIGSPVITGSVSFPSGVRQSFVPASGSLPGLNVGAVATDPSGTLTDADVWFNSTSFQFKGRANGVTARFMLVTDAAFSEGDVFYVHNGLSVRLGIGGNGTFLGSNGTDPLWSTPAGSGTVNSGVIGNVPVYTGSGTTVGPMTNLLYTDASNLLAITQAGVGSGSGDTLFIKNTMVSTNAQNQSGGSIHLSGTAWDYSVSPANGSSVSIDTRLQEQGTAFLADTQNNRALNITAVTAGPPMQVTTDDTNNFVTGDRVVIAGALGNTAVNGTWFIRVISNKIFVLVSSAAQSPGAWTSGGTVAKASLGSQVWSQSVNGGSYTTQAGVWKSADGTYPGGLFVGSTSPPISAAPLQVTGAIYQTSNGQGMPSTYFGQGGGTPYIHTDFRLNVTNTETGFQAGGNDSVGHYAMGVSLAPTSNSISSNSALSYAAGYFETRTTASDQAIWGLNPVAIVNNTITNGAATGMEIDINTFSGSSNAPDPPAGGRVGQVIGLTVTGIAGGGKAASAAIAVFGSGLWKHGLYLTGIGQASPSSGKLPTIIMAGDSSNTNIGYGLDFQGSSFLSTGAAIRIPNNVPIVARNAANGADLKLMQVDGSNILGFGRNQGSNAYPATFFGSDTPWVSAGSPSPTVGISKDDGNVASFGVGAIGAQVNFLLTRADGVTGALTSLQPNEIIFNIQARGYETGTPSYSNQQASIRAQVITNAWSATDHNTILTFSTTPLASTTMAEGMRLDGSGNLLIGTTTATEMLTVAKNIAFQHLRGNTSAPTIAAAAGAGTGPTVSIAGTDSSGTITVQTGTGVPASSSDVVIVTFNVAYGVQPRVVISPANQNAGALAVGAQVWINQAGGSTTTFKLTSGASGLASSVNNYQWNYVVVQ